MALRADPTSIAPERAIVFEVEGSLKDFYAQATVLGLDYLGEFEDEFDPTQDFYNLKDRRKKLSSRIYLAMPDVRALQELLSLWARYKQRRNMPAGRAAWRELFDHLVDVRPWGPQDRLTDETAQAWAEDLNRNPQLPVRIEVELWFHENPDRRTAAANRLQAEVTDLGGAIIHHATISDIRYDAVLIDLPAAHVQTLIEQRDVALARIDDIMFLRPQSLIKFSETDEAQGDENIGIEADAEMDDQEPLAALLDGLPVQNHARLGNWVRVDDPDDLGPTYPVALRKHGTEMASLIVHGDLNRGEAPIRRPLHVRPIFQATQHDERTPENRLLVDVIYRAVRRMKEGDGAEAATAPSVAVINLSLGDEKRPFSRLLSPLARLLDYLSYKYRVLFLVSAGNVLARLPVPAFDNLIEFEAATPEQRERAILEALNSQKSQRTLLSPAEAMNVLTIGAANAGSAFTGTVLAGKFDPFTDEGLPNFISAMGLGFKKCVKPELLFDGGRVPVTVVSSGGGIELAPVRGSGRTFGLKVAYPREGSTHYEDFTWGTSAATALATRAAHKIAESLLDANTGSNHADIDPAYLPLVLKTLLVHCAKWGAKGALLEALFPPQGQGSYVPRRDDITRLLGYGVPQLDRVLDCTTSRATLLGWGTIDANTSLLYRIPLPEDLDGAPIPRAATVTAAWFSPVNSRHKGYRMASLDIVPGGTEKYWITEDREIQPSDKTIVRGTVFHERRIGQTAKLFVDDGNLLLRIECRATAGELAESIPYAMAVSFEVSVDTEIAVYDRIRERLEAPILIAGP